MPQSLSQVFIHIVFSTKDRVKYLDDTKIRKELYTYIAGILRNKQSIPIIINGTNDHLHILCSLPRDISISNLIKDIKRSSSVWIKTKDEKQRFFHWQIGYGAFSVSYRNIQAAEHYIANQESHHKIITFKEEFLNFLHEHNMKVNEKYLWD